MLAHVRAQQQYSLYDKMETMYLREKQAERIAAAAAAAAAEAAVAGVADGDAGDPENAEDN